jgi:nucleoside-diphosphate kinase
LFSVAARPERSAGKHGSISVTNTLGIVKPDGVRRKLVGRIISRIEEAGLVICGVKTVRLTRPRAEEFYAVHRGKSFYPTLMEFMISGPIFVMAISGDDAINRWRALMGATDPASAAADTIRRDFGTSVENNVVHGSDGPETARAEIAFFFTNEELLPTE